MVEGNSVYQNITRNASVLPRSTNQKCFFLDPLNDYKPGELLYVESVVTTAINFFCSLIATSGNAVIILTFLKSDNLRSQSHLLLWCLAFADFLTGLIVQPFYGAYKVAYLFGHTSASCTCRVITEIVAWFSAAVSCALFAAITGERYLALHYHLRYNELVTTRKIQMYLVHLVIGVGVLSLSRFAVKNVKIFLYINIAGLLLSVFTLLISFWKIYKQVRRHFLQIQAQSYVSTGRQPIDVQRFKRTVINMAYVSGLYMVSYLPFTCVLFAYVYVGFTSEVEAFYDITRTLAFLPSSWNPFLYFWKMHELRAAVKSVIGKDSAPLTEVMELWHK